MNGNLPPCSQAIWETTWQLPPVQTLYGYKVMAIAVFHSSSDNRVSACDTISKLWEQGFHARQSNCLLQVLLLKWSRNHARKNHHAERLHYSAIEQSLLKWNGCDCDISMHDCRVTALWNLIGTANLLAEEVTVWTWITCQAVSPMAWEGG